MTDLADLAVLVLAVAVLSVAGFGVGIIASRRIVRWEDRTEEADDGEP